jgi:hypothetical protein
LLLSFLQLFLPSLYFLFFLIFLSSFLLSCRPSVLRSVLLFVRPFMSSFFRQFLHSIPFFNLPSIHSFNSFLQFLSQIPPFLRSILLI